MSILSDYTEMVTELTEWQTKTDKMQKELEEASPAEEAAEYSAELLGLLQKLQKKHIKIHSLKVMFQIAETCQEFRTDKRVKN